MTKDEFEARTLMPGLHLSTETWKTVEGLYMESPADKNDFCHRLFGRGRIPYEIGTLAIILRAIADKCKEYNVLWL